MSGQSALMSATASPATAPPAGGFAPGCGPLFSAISKTLRRSARPWPSPGSFAKRSARPMPQASRSARANASLHDDIFGASGTPSAASPSETQRKSTPASLAARCRDSVSRCQSTCLNSSSLALPMSPSRVPAFAAEGAPRQPTANAASRAPRAAGSSPAPVPPPPPPPLGAAFGAALSASVLMPSFKPLAGGEKGAPAVAPLHPAAAAAAAAAATCAGTFSTAIAARGRLARRGRLSLS
mmetsp:Transcript_174551/g.559612  ORF Transcript_174551/g.559612 Transcript_174551/m.559612 type:complete len:240 (-) Transcript_174551:62-781(-)